MPLLWRAAKPQMDPEKKRRVFLGGGLESVGRKERFVPRGKSPARGFS